MSQISNTLLKLGDTVPAAINNVAAVRIAVNEFATVAPDDETDVGPAMATNQLTPDEAVARNRATAMARLERASTLGATKELSRDLFGRTVPPSPLRAAR